ncbi:NAD(P)-binding protein [Decorospora gaudefroyi]|uniref:NAD(P)-binding protein n=1 Tax=Decorospora gaudefroyi TaxID=184978 RepID=A0A6A5K7Y4_9PLEO|nr:NAD(P)-binding protein [Decorospora gaudefroyi]
MIPWIVNYGKNIASCTQVWILSALVIYWLAVRLLRYRYRDSIPLHFNYPTRSSWADMTLNDAHQIHLKLTTQEFPSTFSLSLFFALFKTYGIPSISNLIIATGQVATPEKTSKRAADTGVLLAEVMANEPGSERNVNGIALVNYLHGRYIKAGKIKNEDMLYTLSLMALEPIRWTDKYEWRCVTDLEKCALGVYWKDLGEAMKISSHTLPSASKGWRDGLHWLEELEVWSAAYEAKSMLPSASNAALAKGTFDIGLFNLPRGLKPVAYGVAMLVLEPRLRTAMKLPDPPAVYSHLFNTAIHVRKWALRNLFLPRPYCLRVKWFTEMNGHSGRAHFCSYTAHPWYIKPSFSARWGPKALILRAFGGMVPGNQKYCPDGYRIRELGPEELVGKGDVINYSTNSSRAETLLSELNSIPGPSSASTPRIHLIRGDMSNKPSVQALVSETINKMGRLDVVISNAGWTRMTTFTDIEQQIDDSDWDKCFTMNVKTHLWLAYAAKDALSATEGVFISTASVAGVKPSGSSVPYAVTKAAQIHLVKSLAVVFAPRVRVNCVSPGMLLTEWGLKFPEEKRKAAVGNTKLKRLATVEDVADQVRCLALSRSVTGQNVVIDGGSSL